MKPELVGATHNVRARCPDCRGAISTFEVGSGGNDWGYFMTELPRTLNDTRNKRQLRITYRLLKCAGCGTGALADIVDHGSVATAKLRDFYPRSIQRLPLPDGVPPGITSEFREAEVCAAARAYRAASALLRSTLEKTLKENGFADRSTLWKRINEAAATGVITEARRARAQEDVRVLGNDVLHEPWREVDAAEVKVAHRYVNRVIEDFYDDRASVLAVLEGAGKLPPQGGGEGDEGDVADSPADQGS